MNVLPKAKNFNDLPVISKINILAQEKISDDEFMKAISDFEIVTEEEVNSLGSIIQQHRPQLAKNLEQAWENLGL